MIEDNKLGGSSANSASTASSALNHGDSIAEASVILPPFWDENIPLWFAQVEATFILKKVTNDKSKFFHVITALKQDLANLIEDMILNPPTERPYMTLKITLIERTGKTEQKRIESLISTIDMGNQTPSAFTHSRRLKRNPYRFG